MRYELPQPVTRHAVDTAHEMAGYTPVRRGIAVAAVVGGALSAVGVTTTGAFPQPLEPDVDPSVIGLAAKHSDSDDDRDDDRDEDSRTSRSSDDEPAVLDEDAVAESVRSTNDEGRRLAAQERRSHAAATDGDDAAVAPTATGAPARAGDASMPADLIDTDDWYLTLPTGKSGNPDTIDGSKLAGYHSKFFELNDSRDGIVFSAGAGGAHTSGSKYPRSELREMNGDKKASWDGRKGTHTMELDQAITAAPEAKPDVIAGQIHATSDDLMQIHLSGKQLTVKYADGKKKVVLDDDYQLGTRFTTKIESSGGHVKVWYNGQQRADLAINSSTSYFKAGAYVNCNTGSDMGQVVVYRADVTHSA